VVANLDLLHQAEDEAGGTHRRARRDGARNARATRNRFSDG